MSCFLMLVRMVFNQKMMLFLVCIYSGERGHLGKLYRFFFQSNNLKFMVISTYDYQQLLSFVVLVMCRSCTLLTCTSKGNASVRSIGVDKSTADSASISVTKTWKVCGSGNVLCSKVDGSENYAVFGG